MLGDRSLMNDPVGGIDLIYLASVKKGTFGHIRRVCL